MELWIRSQDKELLVLAKGFELQHLYNKECQIFAVWQNNYQCVGKYESKKRTLEVLDEIQKLLMPKAIMQQVKLDEYELKLIPEMIVYQMPKE